MCGIYGQVSLSGLPLSHEHCKRSLERLQHRGPDEEGTWIGQRAFLGVRRLSIIDLTRGSQPIGNEDNSLVIVYNGELYNYQSLREELKSMGHQFRTHTDTEVIIHAFEQWGPGSLSRLNGMFAFGIWDERTQSLFLARDRVGEKPLYYFQSEGRLAFASEIKALLEDMSIPRHVSLTGMVNFFATGHALAPKTIYDGVFKLLPGHYLMASGNGVYVKKYWDVGHIEMSSREQSEEETALRVRELLDDSVCLRLMADVPLGAFLSGGVDSSAVVGSMSSLGAEVKTFSLGFSAGGGYDESSDARRVAAHFHTTHHELLVEHADLIGILEKLVYHYDEPFGDPAGFPIYLLSKFASEHVKVVLVGDGGDELFGGYRRYTADQFAPRYQILPRAITANLPRLVDRLPRARRLKKTVNALGVDDPGHRYAAWLLIFTPDMLAELLMPSSPGDLDLEAPSRVYRQYYQELGGLAVADHLNRLMYVDFKTILPDGYMEKVDKATMAASVEARCPLLDPRMVELAFQLPAGLKIKGWQTKRILKRAVADLVPEWVLHKPKHGFSVPTDLWFRGPLKDFAFEILMDPRTKSRGFFNSEFIERLWREHQQGRHVWNEHLWLLLNFELWVRTYIDSR